MSAASLYEALHETIAEQVALDDPLSSFELLGVIEQVKADILAADDLDDDDEDEDCGCADEACAV